MSRNRSPVHAARAAVALARDEEAARLVAVYRTPAGTYETADGVWVIEASDQHWRTCQPHPGCDGHDVQYTAWTVGYTPTGFMADWCEGYPTLRAASAALARHITAYGYEAGLGEQCAVCGQPRGADQMHLGWWWHTACRASTDPRGAARATGQPQEEN